MPRLQALEVPPVTVEPIDADTVRLTWTETGASFLVQESTAPSPDGIWWAIDQAPVANGDDRELVRVLDPAMSRCFFRLRPRGALPGIDYLLANQDPTGLWNPGTAGAFGDTVAALDALLIHGVGGTAMTRGGAALGALTARNHDELARRTQLRAGLTQDVVSAIDELLDGQGAAVGSSTSPSYPGRTWGLAPGFGGSTLDTALVHAALRSGGVEGGLAVGDEAVGVGETSPAHPFVITSGASAVVLRVHRVSGSSLRFNLTPPGSGTLFVDIAPRTTPIDISPLPTTAGTWTLEVVNLGGVAASYSAEVGYSTSGGFDTFRMSSPLIYLARSQNTDGGWGIGADTESHLMVTAEVARNLAGAGTGFVAPTVLNAAAAWLAGKQNGDGGFSSVADSSNVAETALALRALAAVDPTVNLTAAADFLRAGQGYDGAWNDSVPLTALAVSALHLPPQVSPIPDQTVTAPDAFATIQLDDFVADPDHADAEISWTVTGASAIQVAIVNRVVTLSYAGGTTPSETLTFTATDPDGLSDTVTATFTVGVLAPVDYTIARGASVTDSRQITGDEALLDQTASFTEQVSGIPANVSYARTAFFRASATAFEVGYQISAGASAPLGDHEFQVTYELHDEFPPAGAPLGPVTGNTFNFKIRITP
ncbi:MAG: prenyltransferase/squalene oxidase repeat-containing protein [Limisphaerales bacterium]